MGQVMFIVWRESVEALLVVGILYAWLKNGDADARHGLPYLWGGVALGILAAIGLGVALVGFTEVLSGDAQDYFQTGMVLVACVLIVQMVLWMKQHGRTLKREMEASLEQSTRDANWWGVTVLVALAIAREGSETVIFLYGLGFGQSGHVDASQYVAVLIGLALAFFTFYLLQLGGKVFSWRHFFRVTEIMLLFLGAGLFQTGVDKLIDKEILPTLIDRLWNSSAILDDSSTFGSLVATLTGYRAHPALMNLVAYAAYWLVVWFLVRRATGRAGAPANRKAA
ncbi:MAG TPA: FTR1 family protein [Paraburkholderia sp.]|uniref:FTR1 family iron permease n=1 Tax=Paraburkholderia sp. TaxID=1926495 RepID=UPI002C35415D|nr:FTR1 family protein [Paraburkholderia sp.]HTR10964.1 FTR1 family protein [Paraburkholderia sp.]